MTFDVEVEALSEDKKTDYSVEKKNNPLGTPRGLYYIMSLILP